MENTATSKAAEDDNLPIKSDDGAVAKQSELQDSNHCNEVVQDSESASDDDDDNSSSTYIGYTPSSDFEEVLGESLIDIVKFNPDTELWLIQLPLHQALDDFEGQKVSLGLDNEQGHYGNIKTKCGKVYKMVEFPSPVASDIFVFVTSPSGLKTAGKISRHVNLARFPEPEDVKQNADQKKADSEPEFGTKHELPACIHISSSTESDPDPDPDPDPNRESANDYINSQDCSERDPKRTKYV